MEHIETVDELVSTLRGSKELTVEVEVDSVTAFKSYDLRLLSTYPPNANDGNWQVYLTNGYKVKTEQVSAKRLTP
jgi:hypothetical protein